MGWKVSMIIIEDNGANITDETLLAALGEPGYRFDKEATFEECIYPSDNSISIGYYNGNIVVCDDYVITSKILEQSKEPGLTAEEQRVASLFPDSEIIAVSCHSVTNFHAYSIMGQGQKIRRKVVADGVVADEYGTPVEEEQKLYDNAYVKDGIRYWKNKYDTGEQTEDVFMEDFTFNIAKRRLGVRIDHEEADSLFQATFRKYLPVDQNSRSPVPAEKTASRRKSKWKYWLIIFALILTWQILKKVVFK
jgi:hypothetical protein